MMYPKKDAKREHERKYLRYREHSSMEKSFGGEAARINFQRKPYFLSASAK